MQRIELIEPGMNRGRGRTMFEGEIGGGRQVALRVTLAAALAVTFSVVLVTAGEQPTAEAGLEDQTAILVEGSCTLPLAVAAANSGASAGACANPTGSTYIQIAAEPITALGRSATGTIVATVDGPTHDGVRTMLPAIGVDILIEGVDGAGIYMAESIAGSAPRLAYVEPAGSLTLRSTTIAGFSPVGITSAAEYQVLAPPTYHRTTNAGDVRGGAIYADGALTLEHVVMHDNSATGGASGFTRDSETGPYAPKHGGNAEGGAIYTRGTVTIRDSAFHSNVVRGGSGATGQGVSSEVNEFNFFDAVADRHGGDGGDARGADIAADPGAVVDIDGAIFSDSAAFGGDGGIGTTSDMAKSLTLPDPAPHGADGTCDDSPTQSEVDGRDGAHGSTGTRGGRGGNGGDATGSLAVQGVLTMNAVTIVSPSARAGSAGEYGLPSLGGEGGDGGDGETCSVGGRFGDFSSDVYNGKGGDGGDSGDPGIAYRQGNRGVAVAALHARDLTMINTTVYEGSAIVPDDRVEDFPNKSTLRSRLARVNPERGAKGLGASNADDGEHGDLGGPSNLLALEQTAGPGGAAIVSSRGGSMSFSTLFGGSITMPSSDGGRTRPATISPLLLSFRTDIEHSILSGLPNARESRGCEGASSQGYNVITEDTSCPRVGPDDVAFPAGASPTAIFLSNGDRILAIDGFGDEHRIRTLAPRNQGEQGTHAVDLGPPGELCTVLGGDRVFDDARGLRRAADTVVSTPDDSCDSGARELREVVTQVTLLDVEPAYVDDIDAPGLVRTTVGVHYKYAEGTGESAPARLMVEFSDDLLQVDAVRNLPADASFEIQGNRVIATVPPTVDDPGGLGQLFSIDVVPVAASNETVTVTATIESPGDSVPNTPSDETSFDVRYDPAFEFRHAGVDEVVSRCNASYPMDFEVEATGESALPIGFDFEVRPLGQPRLLVGSGSVSTESDHVGWRPASLRTAKTPESIRVAVDAGDFAIGETFQPTYTYVRPSLGTTLPLTTVLPGVRTVAPAGDLSIEFSGLDDLNADETRTVTATVANAAPTPCGDLTDIALTTTVDGAPVVLDAPALVGSGSVEFTFDVTAPSSPGVLTIPYELDFAGSALVGGPLAGDLTAAVDGDPTSAIVLAAGQDPVTDDDVIDFTVTFDEPVTGFENDDVLVSGGTGADTVVVSGSGDTYQVQISGMTSSGTVGAKVRSGAAAAVSDGDPTRSSGVASAEYDITGPFVTVNYLQGPEIAALPVEFAIDLYDQPQSNVTIDDLVIGGTADPSGFSLAPGSGPGDLTAILTITTAANAGTIEVSVLDGVVVDQFGNPSTFDDRAGASQNVVTYFTPPTAPTIVDAIAGDAEVELTWDPPGNTGGLALEKYDIEVSEDPTDASSWDLAVADVAPDATSVVIDGLANGVPVALRLNAFNAVGDGPFSDPSELATPNPRPTVEIVPAGSQAVPATGSPIELVAAFDVPVSGFDADDVILGGTADPTDVVVSPTGGTAAIYTLTITGMQGDGTVTAQIVDSAAQRASLQASVESDVYSMPLDEVEPTAYVSVARDQRMPAISPRVAFRVAFDEAVSGFTVDDLVIGGTAGGAVHSLTPSTTTQNAWDIEIDMNYLPGSVTLDVPAAAATDIAGRPSTTIVISNTVDLITPPGPPLGLVATAGDGTASVTWDPPAVTGGAPIDGYIVAVSVDGGAFEEVPDSLASRVFSIDGMTNGEPVRFQVSAFNAAGGGESSLASTVVTPTPAPSVVLAAVPGQEPATTSPVKYTATFSEPVIGLESDDIILDGSSNPTTIVVTDTGDSTTFDIDVSGMAKDGNVALIVLNDAAVNANGQPNTDSALVLVDFDGFGPIATVDLAPGQAAEVTSTPVVFAVDFDEAVTGFDSDDITISGTAGASSGVVSGSGDSYLVTVDSVGEIGTVVLEVRPGAVDDEAGNASTVTVIADTVTVGDATGPVISTPDTIEVTLPDGAATVAVEYVVTAEDPPSNAGRLTEAIGGSVPVSCSPASGSQFEIGETTVSCTASDDAGNTSTASFLVVVSDDEVPVFPPADEFSVAVTAADNGVVTFDEPTAIDNSGDVTVTCQPPSGSVLPVGANTITCSAVDGSGNVSSMSFSVTVQAPSPSTELPRTGNGSIPIDEYLLIIAVGVILVAVSRRRRSVQPD